MRFRFIVLLAAAACSRSSTEAPAVALPAPTALPSGSVALAKPPPPPPEPTADPSTQVAAPAPVPGIPPGGFLVPGPTNPPLPAQFASNLVHSVQLDADHAYYTDSRGFLWSSPKDGSAKPTQVAARAMMFFVDATTVTYVSGKSVMRVAKTGGTPTTLVTEHEDPVHIVTDGTSIFYSLFDGTPIRKLPYAGGASVAIHPGIKSGALAVDAQYLYVADYSKGTVTRVAKAGGTPTLVASVSTGVGLLVDEKFLYVTSEKDGSVRRVPKAGGTVDVLARGAVNHDQPAQDATYVYWTSGGQDMALFRAKKDATGRPEMVHSVVGNPNQIALDETRFFVTGNNGVMVFPKTP